MPAAYFENFPFVGYSLNRNPQPNEITLVTDIFRRVAPIRTLLTNAQMFYDYQIVDGETPESIAYRVYGSTKYHWVVTLFNNILDPLLDWPKNYSNLVAYIIEKYGSIAAAAAAPNHYSMTQSKVDSLGNASEKTFIIDEAKYDSLTGLVPVVTVFGDGVTVTTTTTRAVIDAYTYETELNELKRNILLAKAVHLPAIVSQVESTLL
jgi:hypothetical protein